MSEGFNYNTINRTIPAGEESVFNITGSYVIVVEASHADFKVRLEGGAKNYWAAGIMIGGPEALLPFKQISLVNEGAPLTITMIYGTGQVRDGRVSFPGGNLPVIFDGTQPIAFDGTQSVNVLNFPATQPVSLAGTQAVAVQNFPATQEVTFANIARLEDSFTKLTEIVATLASPSGRLSKGFVDLTGASYAFCANNTVVLAAAGANINGVIIHRFSGENLSATRQSALYYDGMPITNISPSDKSTSQFVENFFLPAGKEVKIVAVGPYQRGYCWYEVL